MICGGITFIHHIIDELEKSYPQFWFRVFNDPASWGTKILIYIRNTKDIAGTIEVDKDIRRDLGWIEKVTSFCDDYIKNRTIRKEPTADPKVFYCTACGAPLKNGSHKCEYCGTEYWS